MYSILHSLKVENVLTEDPLNYQERGVDHPIDQPLADPFVVLLQNGDGRCESRIDKPCRKSRRKVPAHAAISHQPEALGNDIHSLFTDQVDDEYRRCPEQERNEKNQGQRPIEDPWGSLKWEDS